MKAADKLDAPVILQASRGARTYAGDQMLKAMVTALVEMYPDVRSLCCIKTMGITAKYV